MDQYEFNLDIDWGSAKQQVEEQVSNAMKELISNLWLSFRRKPNIYRKNKDRVKMLFSELQDGDVMYNEKIKIFTGEFEILVYFNREWVDCNSLGEKIKEEQQRGYENEL